MRELGRRGTWAALGVLRNNIVGLATQALLGLLLLGVVLTPVFGVGIPVLVEVLELVRAAATRQRRWSARVLGVEVPDPYPSEHPAGSAATYWARLQQRTRTGSTWRDLVWLAWQSLAGPLAGGAVLVLGYAAYRILVAPDTGAGYLWSTPVAGLLLVVLLLVAIPLRQGQRVISRWLLAEPGRRTSAAERIEELTRTRANTVDAQAAELRRIERDLHDGVQARLVSLGLSISLARSAMPGGPQGSPQADALLGDAQEAIGTTLDELRALIRGIHPPVLAERGLAGAVEALAMAAAVPVTTTVDLPGRFEPATESAVYFAAAEALTNISRHARAEHAHLELTHRCHRLRLRVVDDGAGGADPDRGTGLHGVGDRLAGFDGTITVTSPLGGPTEIRMELPCAPSSPKTSPCSATASPVSSKPTESPSSTP